MIPVTRLDGSQFYVNAELIQIVESRPDTHIVLVNGQSYIVREPDDEVVAAILMYRQMAYGSSPAAGAHGAHGALRALQGQAG